MDSRLVLLLALCCVGSALAAEPIALHYHETIGIPEARRIQQFEAAAASKTSEARIAGGRPAALGAHPYLAGLLVELTTGQTSVCGASLLSATKLVTAAHCWWDGRLQGERATVVLGSLTLFSGGTRLAASSVESHASFNPRNLNNDVAIVTIPAVQLSDLVQPIRLPEGFMAWLTFEYSRGVVAGYGVTRDEEAITLAQTQREVTVLVVNNLDCATVYGFNVVDSTLCTSGLGRVGPCGGDSGGPLAVSMSGTTYLVGVVSFHAFNGCDIGFPGGYARVTSFLPWIRARL